MDWFMVLSWACIISTVGSFTAGFPDFQVILRNKTTGQTPFTPFLMGLLVNLGSLAYGILTYDFTILVVNSIGTALNVFYVLIYTYYAVDQVKTRRSLFLAIFLIAAISLYLKYVVATPKLVLNYLGMVNLVLVLTLNVSPMAELQNVMESQSSASLSFPLALGMFSNSTLWCLYGVVLKDVFITTPSVPGIFSSLIQFYFIAKYPKELKKKDD